MCSAGYLFSLKSIDAWYNKTWDRSLFLLLPPSIKRPKHDLPAVFISRDTHAIHALSTLPPLLHASTPFTMAVDCISSLKTRPACLPTCLQTPTACLAYNLQLFLFCLDDYLLSALFPVTLHILQTPHRFGLFRLDTSASLIGCLYTASQSCFQPCTCPSQQTQLSWVMVSTWDCLHLSKPASAAVANVYILRTRL